MKLTWFGHSCFLLEGSKKILIDPFVPSGTLDVEPDIVAVTHAHADHLGMAAELRATTVAVNEVARYLARQDVPTEPMNIGGTITVDGVRFTMTPALHSSWLEDAGPGFYGGVAAGYVIVMDDLRVYHAGDTGLFSDMQLIRDLYRPDIALLPIGGRYTMGPDEAMIAAQYIGAKVVIPIHYGTFPAIEQDVQPFKHALERTTAIRVEILAPGDSLEIKPDDLGR